jgi:hypothetical protein
MINYNNKYLVLFSNTKKTVKTPDYSGFLNDANKEKLADAIFYIRTSKEGKISLAGFFFYPEDTIKCRVNIDQLNSDISDLPSITGSIDIKDTTYKLALWAKKDKNDKIYYSGKINL